MNAEPIYFKLRFNRQASPKESDIQLVNQLNAFVDAHIAGTEVVSRTIVESFLPGYWMIENNDASFPTVRGLVTAVAEELGTNMRHIESIKTEPIRISLRGEERVSVGGIIIPSDIAINSHARFRRDTEPHA